MPLRPGATRYHGIVLNNLEAREFKNQEKRLRKQIDCGNYQAALEVLAEIKSFAGEDEVNRRIFEKIRRDADARWKRTWESS